MSQTSVTIQVSFEKSNALPIVFVGKTKGSGIFLQPVEKNLCELLRCCSNGISVTAFLQAWLSGGAGAEGLIELLQPQVHVFSALKAGMSCSSWLHHYRTRVCLPNGGVFAFYVAFNTGLFRSCFFHSPLLAAEMGPSSFGPSRAGCASTLQRHFASGLLS